MDDKHIVELYWERNEQAISETAQKYGNYLNSISFNIVSNAEDACECVNDTYHRAWTSMPPHRPTFLSTYLGKIVRRVSIDCVRKKHAKKRGGNEVSLVLEELNECIPSDCNVEREIERKELLDLIHKLLEDLPALDRRIFLCRYWYVDSIDNIAKQYGMSKNKVRSMLYRTRNTLKNMLERSDVHEF